MAEAVGLGSGIIAFLTVSVQVSAVLYSMYDDFTEAPEEIQNIAGRIEILNFYLDWVQKEEQRLNAGGFTSQINTELAKLWASRYVKLRDDTAEFRDYEQQLKRKVSSGWNVRSRVAWVIKNKRRVLEFDGKVTRHLTAFERMLDIVTQEGIEDLKVLQHQHFNDTSKALVTQSEQIRDLNSSQIALHTESHVYLRNIETLAQRSTTTIENTIVSEFSASRRQTDMLGLKIESLDRRLNTSDLVTQQFLAAELNRIQGQVTQEIRNIAPNIAEPIYTTLSTTQSIVQKSVSVCFSNWSNYRFPIGQLQVFTKSKKTKSSSNTESTNGHRSYTRFGFFPAPWLSNTNIVAYIQFYSTPRMPTWNLDYPITISVNNQAFLAIENNDISLLQRLLGSDNVRPNDRDKFGWTLLHKAARWRRPEMCNILISEGADTNATDDSGMTPLHVACEFGVSQTVVLLINNASDMSDSVISAATRAYSTIPSIFHRAVGSLFFRLFEDFTGFEDMDPALIATILCFHLSGAFKLPPGTRSLRSWLLSRRPKHLDSGLPTEGLISDELQRLFSNFTGAQMKAMVTAVRHSCRVKSPDLFILLSNHGIIDSISSDEVLFSLSIASECGNLVPIRKLQKMKTSLHNRSGSYSGGQVKYQGRAEMVKAILDEETFNKSPKAITSNTSNGASQGVAGSGYGITSLMFAAVKGDIDALRYLIETGEDVQAADWRGRTALDHAMASNKDNSEAIIELLQEAQDKAELRRSLALAAGHTSSQGSLKHSDQPSLQAKNWVYFTQVHSFLMDWWEYLRKFTLSDVYIILSALLVFACGAFGYFAYRYIFNRWFMYLVAAYSIYLLGKSRGQA